MLSPKLDWLLANPKWAAELNPIITNPMNGITILPNISLTAGVNPINHGLTRKPNGWVVVDIQGPQTIYRSAPYNSATLILTASGAVTVSIGVF